MKKALTTMAALALLAGSAQAASIAINFQRSSNGDTAMDAADVAGFGSAAQSNWNNVTQAAADSGSIADLVTDAGGNSGVSVQWAGDTSWSAGNGASNGDNKMMNGYLDDTAATPEGSGVTFTNISFDLFDVYVYVGSDGDGRTGSLTDGSTTYSYTTASATGGGFPGGYLLTDDTAGGNPSANYAVFSGLSGDSVTITNLRGSNNTGIHGIQIVEAAIPEPSSALLFGTGLFGLAFRRRRNS